ncbi:MAG: V-type ATP synthase subunit E [Archaeoglobaceae archaeon]
MPLEPVLEEITRKGDELVKKILEEAESEAKSIIDSAKAEANEILRKAREEAEKEAEAIKRQEISSISLEMKRAKLNKQKEIIESVFNILRQRLKEMDQKNKIELLKKLIEKNAKPGMFVYSSKAEEKLVKDIIKNLKLDLKFAGNIECLGGIILEDPATKIRLNLTFDEFLVSLYEQKLSEVSKILFG